MALGGGESRNYISTRTTGDSDAGGLQSTLCETLLCRVNKNQWANITRRQIAAQYTKKTFLRITASLKWKDLSHMVVHSHHWWVPTRSWVTAVKMSQSACFDSTYTKIGTIQRRLAWPLHKDDMQIREEFHTFNLGLACSYVRKKANDILDYNPSFHY